MPKPPPKGFIYIEDFTFPDGTVLPGIASRLGITPGTYRKWRMDGRGPASFKPGKKVLAREDAPEQWLATQAREAGALAPHSRPAEPRIRTAA